MKTIAQQLNVTEFPFIIRDKNGRVIYSEGFDGSWCKKEYDSNGNEIYFKNSDGEIEDNRAKECEYTIVEIKGKKFKLTELT